MFAASLILSSGNMSEARTVSPAATQSPPNDIAPHRQVGGPEMAYNSEDDDWDPEPDVSSEEEIDFPKNPWPIEKNRPGRLRECGL